ncbi:MAG TPA: Fe-Mn family superoxide dismutase [Candidatus Paceibacterota bacterium]|nr:Fe-Mn family superoxide dismutase [Candidatus Paceibacterota bacterium]HMP19038.1 Fe-Mn family superoxide dismutase [Candidatus Paceibacterota bacterium]HMP85197.1 Fe-Mn family superoxide dismutase [Candidatus Paceibacterota bacterium]
MKNYEVKKFNIPELVGISAKNIEEHLKLYEGYVKNTNNILNEIENLANVPSFAENIYLITELQRRFSFEFDGMRNHEYFFANFEGGSKPISNGALKKAIIAEWGSFEKWLDLFKMIAKTRGPGWAILYHDTGANRLLNCWVDEQHLGHLIGLEPILCLDMWEHSYVADYQPSGKGKYIEDFFTNLNWEVVEGNLR